MYINEVVYTFFQFAIKMFFYTIFVFLLPHSAAMKFKKTP